MCRHDTLQITRWAVCESSASVSRSDRIHFALRRNVAREHLVAAIHFLFSLVRYVWRLADGFADMLILGVVRHGFAWVFLFGPRCAICFRIPGVDSARASWLVSLSPRRICCEHRIHRFNPYGICDMVDAPIPFALDMIRVN
jgi:hypothetical protein